MREGVKICIAVQFVNICFSYDPHNPAISRDIFYNRFKLGICFQVNFLNTKLLI